MSSFDRSWPGIRRLKFAGEGKFFRGGAVEWLVGLALVGVIAVSVYFAFWSEGRPPETPAEHYYICQACTHRFVQPEDEAYLKKLDQSADAFWVPGPIGPLILLDCPSCGGTDTAVPALVCPNPDCREWFIPDKAAAVAELAREGADSGEPRFLTAVEGVTVCPKCRMEYMQALQEYDQPKAQP